MRTVIRLTTIASLTLFSFSIFSQLPQGWNVEYTKTKAFIPNKGQFDLPASYIDVTGVKYACDATNLNYFFTSSGVTMELSSKHKVVKSDEEKAARAERKTQPFNTLKEWQDFESVGNRIEYERDVLTATWVGSNPDVELIAEQPEEAYHNYSYYDENRQVLSVDHVLAYQKLTYKNLYPNIDVVYEFHPESGIKYSVIVHPGGDISQVKLSYSKDISLQADGTIHTATHYGDIIDHAPVTFYDGQTGSPVASAYTVSGNIISFSVPEYDATKTLVIDPWTQTPTFPSNWDCVWECEQDASGNVYIIGGVTPLQLIKYNAAGVQQWTYNTPYDTSMWLGTFATDDAGNSYVTNGSTAMIQKVSTGGALVWNNSSPGGLFGSTEFWNIEFNCDQTMLVIGGTGGVLPPLPYIYNINMATGNVINSVQVCGSTISGIPPNTQEVRSIIGTTNEKYYFLTQDTIGYVDQGLTPCPGESAPFHVNNGIDMGYKCDNWRYNNTGVEALAYYDGFVYVNRGNQVQKRDFNTAAVVATATIPGGAFTAVFLGGNNLENSGIDVDDCGNIYVGSKNLVVKYDANLVQLATYATTFNVYDVHVNTGGEIIAAGSTGNSGTASRTGKIQSISAGACTPIAITCCNPYVCPVDPLCTSDPAITLTPDTPGGTWSGPAGLNTTTGVFNPAISGAGTFTITYTLLCGSFSFDIIVNPCTALTVCEETNGSITVSGGSGPYTWANWQTSTVSSSDCAACGGTLIFGFCTVSLPCTITSTGYVNFATGTNATPPGGATQVQITDGTGTTLVFNPTTIGPCSTTCDPTITPAGPFCVTGASVNLTAAETGGTWSGTGITNVSLGTFNPATAGVGTHTITYTGTCGLTDTENITVTAATTPTFTAVAPICSGGTLSALPITSTNGITGTWSPALNNTATTTYTFTPTSGQCATTTTLTVTVDPNVTPTFTAVAPICSGGTLSALPTTSTNGITGTWSPALNNTATTTYTFTPTTGQCATTTTLTITVNSNVTPTFTAVAPICSGGTLTALPTTSTNSITGTWSPALNNTATTTYTFTPTTGQCATTTTLTITVNPLDNAAFTYPAGSYCPTDPDPTPTITGLAGGTFSMDNGGVINASTGVVDLSASGLGSFTITYTTNGSCPNSATFAMSITSAADATITPAGPFCVNDAVINLTAADAGGTWSGTGITNATAGTFDPAAAGVGTHTITYTISGSCGATDTETITVTAGDNGAFNYTTASYCLSDPNPTPTITGTPGGTFTISSPGVINATTGQVNLSTSGLGTFTITYTTSGSCPATTTATITVTNGADATITPAGPFCADDAAVNLTAAEAGGTWSGTGITNTSLGTFDPATAGVGTHTITYTISGACGATDTETITVNAAGDASFSYASATYCVSEPNPTPTITGTSGGTFTISGTGVINASTGVINLGTTGAGTFTVTYAVGGACPATATFTVTITNSANTTITPTGPFCEDDPSVNLVAATPGGTWSGPGITNPATGQFDPGVAGPGTHTITYTLSGSCAGSSTTTIVVNPFESAVISYANTSFCSGEADPFPSIMGTIGGTFTIDNGGVINSTTGIIDLSASGSGNFVITYTTPGVCADVSTFNITIAPSVLVDIEEAGPFCLGAGDIVLDATPSGGIWEGNGIIDTLAGIFNPDTAGIGIHEIIYTVSGTCGGDDTILIEVSGPPTAWVSNDTTIFIGDEITLTADGGVSYVWTEDNEMSCYNCQSSQVSPLNTTIYCVRIISSAGCQDTACVEVTVDRNCGDVFIPNAFSPDGMGENNLECVYGKCIATMVFTIYDRWGEKVFVTESQDICWDGMYKGKPLNSGVYVYIFEGTLLTGEKVEKKGNITLVR